MQISRSVIGTMIARRPVGRGFHLTRMGEVGAHHGWARFAWRVVDREKGPGEWRPESWEKNGRSPVAFSPSGNVLAILDPSGKDLALLHVDTGRVTPLARPATRGGWFTGQGVAIMSGPLNVWGPGDNEYGTSRTLWHGDEPYFVAEEGSTRASSP